MSTKKRRALRRQGRVLAQGYRKIIAGHGARAANVTLQML
jgi:hypothetical protein